MSRFYIQRPTGYMSAYSFRLAVYSTRVAWKHRKEQGGIDPVYVRVGKRYLRVPLPVKTRPRKVRCPVIKKDGEQCKQLIQPSESTCTYHEGWL